MACVKRVHWFPYRMDNRPAWVRRSSSRHAVGWGLIGIFGECCPPCLSRLSGRAGRSNFTPARQRCTVQSTNGWCIQLSLRLSVRKRGSEFDSPKIFASVVYIVPVCGSEFGNTTTTETDKKYGEVRYRTSQPKRSACVATQREELIFRVAFAHNRKHTLGRSLSLRSSFLSIDIR
jgi:hypothetical protein